MQSDERPNGHHPPAPEANKGVVRHVIAHHVLSGICPAPSPFDLKSETSSFQMAGP